MSDWRSTTLGDVIELKRGYDLPQQKRQTGNVPIVSSSGINDCHSEAMVKGPGVVTGRYGTIGQVFYVESDFWPLNTTLYVRDFKGNDPRFISYFLRTLDFQAYSDKGAVPGVNRNHLHMAQVKIPPLDIQRYIARILGDLDEKIELNCQINQALEVIAQTIFKSWFVDFEPVRAKIEAKVSGSDPERAAMCAISGKSEPELDRLSPENYQQLADTAAIFPDELVESELGMIPKGWEYRKADEIAEVGIGKTPPRNEPEWFTESPDDMRWVSIRDMGVLGVFMQRTSEYLTKESVSRFNVRVVPSNTVLLSFKLTIGRVAITDGEMTTNEAIAHFKLQSNSNVSTEYLYHYLKQFNYLALGSTSSIANAINSRTIREMPILSADTKIIKYFSAIINPLLTTIKLKQSEVTSLENLRDSLLPKLLNGEFTLNLGERGMV